MTQAVLGILAGILLGVPLSGFLFGRWVDEEAFRRYLRRVATRRGWAWLTSRCTVGEAQARAAGAVAERDVLAQCMERLRALTYHDALAFGPARLGADEQYIRIDIVEGLEGLRPVLIVSGLGRPWVELPLVDATPHAVLQALGPVQEIPLAFLLAQTPDHELRRLAGPQRTALVHAMIRDEEIPGVVEGLVQRHQLSRQKAAAV